MNKSRIFTIAPGAPFLKTFVGALLDGAVVDGYSRSLPPLDLAAATIYVPTRRSARALGAEFALALGRPASLPPRILPLGALEDDETRLHFEEAPLAGAADASPAMGEMARRMKLAELILTWARVLKHAIVSVGPRGSYEVDEAESFQVATSAADAWRLSGELAGLIDELIIEDVAWHRLDPLALPEFDRYWGITLAFLSVAIEEWPKVLAKAGCVDRARRQAELVEAHNRRLRQSAEGSQEGPVIAIGSTGSNRATARLLGAIAAAPRGAIVLPGLDLSLDADAWACLPGDPQAGSEPSFTHPQAALSRLLQMLKAGRRQVIPLGVVAPERAGRARFVSEALRPADSTGSWAAYRASLAAGELAEALNQVVLIEANDEREEALCLAIAMREALETQGASAALVTPDRELARRVGAELLRWGIDVEDTAGEALSNRPCGVLARLLIGCAASGASAESLTGLLAHPALRLGLDRDEVERRAPAFEIGVLRSPLAAGELRDRLLGDPRAIIARARDEARGRHAHPARRRIGAAEWDAAEDLLLRLSARLEPLLVLRGEQKLRTWVEAQRAAFVAVAEHGVGGEEADAADLIDLFDELAENATASMVFDAEGYAHFFAAVAREIVAPTERSAHPRLKIYGLLEARLMEADIMLLGGLDEAVWPPLARADAFLNRPMRAALGLTPPERKLGQTAHDFEQAMGRRRVILSRANKRGGAPAVASRFLQRMAAVGGSDFEACSARGEAYLRLARAIDRPAEPPVSARRPTPRPVISLRPVQLSVTAIEALRRDPYAIYADKILRLAELPPPGAPPGPAELGSAIHAALETFCKTCPDPQLPAEARLKLQGLVRASLAAGHLDDPAFVAFQWPTIVKAIDFYLRFEAARRPSMQSLFIECGGALDIPLADGSTFILSARADRIEVHADKTATLIDYKTGTPPGTQEILVGFSPQLTLEAAMALRGAFKLGGAVEAADAIYLKLLGPNGGEEKPVVFPKAKRSFAEVSEAHFSGLVDLLNQFRDPATPYSPRPFPKFAKAHGVYDHLARVREWSLGADAEEGE